MIDAAYILCIDKRVGLWTNLEQQVKDYFGVSARKFICGSGDEVDLPYSWIDKNVLPSTDWRYAEGISAVRHYRAHLAHKKIITKAMNAGYNNFLLLEDDAIFTERTSQVLEQLTQLEWMHYDLVYFGHHYGEYKDDKAVGVNLEIEQEYEKTGRVSLFHIDQTRRVNVGGFHAVLINAKAYVKLLNLPAIQPLDSLVNLYYRDFNRFLCLPKIVEDPRGFSWCDNREVIR